MLKRLRLKFICINMIIVTVMLSVIFGVVLRITKTNLENEGIQMMRSVSSAPFHLGKLDERTKEVRLPFFMLESGPDGELTAVGGGYYDLSDEEFLRELAGIALASQEEIGLIPEYNLRFCRMKTPAGERMVFSDISSEISAIQHLIKTCLRIGIISFFIFLGISILLARWTVKPVEKAWNQQRQFVADASHELKTPLTVMITNAELLLSPDYDETTHRCFAEHMLTMARQMRVLTESLLDLARVDAGAAKSDWSGINLSELVEEAILPFEPLCFEKGLQLESSIETGIYVKGSEAHLHQVVEILLDNAQKYAADQGRINIVLKRQGRTHCLLSVANSGEAIPEADLENIFKRFYRVDKARTRTGSYGLGLSIARSIVTEHHGKIWAQSQQGENSFFVQLSAG